MQVNNVLKRFKTNSGVVNFHALFQIKMSDRLSSMAKSNFEETLGVLTVALTNAMELMNLSRPMNAAQILDLAEALIDTCDEDQLALEDVLLFLQKLTRGEYGPLYEGMDVPKFMGHFEKYRDDRYQAIRSIREEQAAQHKSFVVNDTINDMFPENFRNQMHADKLYDMTRDKNKTIDDDAHQ